MDQVETRIIEVASNDYLQTQTFRRASKRQERRMRMTPSQDYWVLSVPAPLRHLLNNINSWNLASRTSCHCSIKRRLLHRSHRFSQPHFKRMTPKRPNLILPISWRCWLLQVRLRQSRLKLHPSLKSSMVRFLLRLDHRVHQPTIGSTSKGRCWR